MNITYQINRLPLAGEFKIAKGTYSYRDNMIITLEKDGLEGLGELTVIDYYNINLDELAEKIKDIQPIISGIRLDNPSQLFDVCKQALNDHPFLLSALDCAAYDLYGKLHDQSMMTYLYPEGYMVDHALCSFTLGMQPLPQLIANIKEQDWPILKIKLGNANDHLIVQALQDQCNRLFRIDANGGWDTDQLYHILQICDPKIIELIEQPLPRHQDDGLSQFLASSKIPFIADERFHKAEDLQQISHLYHGINIKLMKCGGLTPALRIIEQARRLGMKIMVGCMTETSVGITAAAHLIPKVDYVDLDGAMLLAEDLAKGVTFTQGKVKYDESPGLGCSLL